jgi:hypothetical protein
MALTALIEDTIEKKLMKQTGWQSGEVEGLVERLRLL